MSCLVACAPPTTLAPPKNLTGEVQTALVEKDCKSMEELVGFNPRPEDGHPVAWRDLDAPTRVRLREAASEWALRECYLPCPYEMSACASTHSNGRYGVQIFPADDRIWLGAQAMILVDPVTFEVTEEIRYHGACIHFRGWVRATCTD